MAAGRAVMLLNIFILLAFFYHSASQIVSITVPKDVWLVNNQRLNADGLDSRQINVNIFYHVFMLLLGDTDYNQIIMYLLLKLNSISALTTNFHILVSRGGGWLGISLTIKF